MRSCAGSAKKTALLVAWAIWIAAYLLGAVPFGLIIARNFAGIDVRKEGSGNIGATNVARTTNKWLGIATLMLDALKGAAPVLISAHALHQPIEVSAGAALAAVLGHVFPIYLLFRGGKGVATAAGVFIALTPISTLIAVAVFAVVAAVTRVVSISSLIAALVLLGAVWRIDGRIEVLYVAIAVVALIFVRHAGNISRLLRRTEHRV